MSERSDAEREAARLERERRRGVSGGAAPVPEPPAHPEPEPTEPEPTEHAAPEPTEHAAPEPTEHEPTEHAASEPPRAEPAPPPEEDRAWAWDQAEEPGAAQPEPPAKPPMRSFPSARPLDWHPDDEPIGTVAAPQPGAPGMSPHRPVTIPRRRRRHPGRLLMLVVPLVLVSIFAGYTANAIFTPFKDEGTGRVVINIPEGATARQIGDLLAEREIVSSGFFFSLRAGLAGGQLRAGRFTLARDMGNIEAINALKRAPAAPKVINVTLPEGPSRAELAPRIKQSGLEGDYLKATERSPRLNPRDYGARKGVSLEGFLFPATYELKPGANVRSLVAQQVEAFKRNFGQIDLRAARRKNLTRYDVLTIASMIEREVSVARERRLVAAVIYNRLKEGIPLGIDATTRYDENNWTRPLRKSELERDSPYNTRNRQGLPPTPIGNPGLGSLRAAAKPAKVGHLYYVVRACGNGAHNFSRTEAEFQRDVAAYQRKREELGRDPSSCP